MTALTLELVHVTARDTVFLWAREPTSWSSWAPLRPCPAPPSGQPLCPPHLSHLHSHGLHRISSAQRCSAHWHRKTHSQSRAEGLGKDRGETGPRRVGIGTQTSRASPALGRLILPITVSLKATVHWHNDQDAQPILGSQLAGLTGIARHRGHSLTHLGWTHEKGHGSMALPSGQTVCWEGRERDKTTKASTGFRERPVKDDGLRHSTGTGGLQGRGRGVVGARHVRDTYLCNPKRTV